MKLTKRQRAQVVELLRCAADVCATDKEQGLYSVALMLGHDTWSTARITGGSTAVWDYACEARNVVHADGIWYGYWHECLEAAARVEMEEM